MPGLALSALAILAGLGLAVLRRRRALEDEVTRLAGLVTDLSARLQKVGEEAARALAAAEVAGNVLVEKGVADEEELEAARERSGLGEGMAYVPGRDGEIH